MSQKKKLTPAQREKKQLAASRRQAEKKQALVKTAVIAGAVLVAVILCAIVFGPVDAAIVGGVAELLNQMLTFGFTPTTETVYKKNLN